jgi:hypothetical protein
MNTPLIAPDSAAWMLLSVGGSLFLWLMWGMVRRIRGQG